MAVATNDAAVQRGPEGGGGAVAAAGQRGLDGVLRALRAPVPASSGAPPCCTWVCRAVVDDVRDRRRTAAVLDDGAVGLAPGDRAGPDPEFEAVLVRRLAHRYLAVVADAAAGRPVPRVWQLLLDPPPVRPVRLALAGIGTLLEFDLTLAVVGTCTILGRTPDVEERDAHRRVAALLAARARDVVRCLGGEHTGAAVVLGDPDVRDAAWHRATQLWTLRGRPSRAEAERAALDQQRRAEVTRVLGGG